ncbi:chemotaxis response regulator protein-glutamate methylesterase [Paenibacillus sp. 598K]|uniref:protein-glutamate methylesterase/protein-glutamine glutaminase n=1 Tax=Paenibacillus sp. 598K TaxID=1117987 RepID=UPI000FF94D3A|nr:chemotaxis response regulator protein-glutamate methylesterase [Paenibacillus sp. 598K]GBF76702.1 chemotaxis response regulator protein-glutamate methylesterase [Paenibacillus sp. 598K]
MAAGQRPISVLIVDDSMVYREVIERGITSDPQIVVVASAGDPFDARDKLLRYRPDVMLCDIEMPRMNGIAFIRRLMPQYALPVIVVSSISDAVLDALHAGAVEFVLKPDIRSVQAVARFVPELIRKIKMASLSTVRHDGPSAPKAVQPVAAIQSSYSKEQIVAIGASTGGIEAIDTLLRSLTPQMPGIVIVQHIPPTFSRMFAERLDASLPFAVREARDGDLVERGQVLIAAGDAHMELVKSGARFKVRCYSGPKVNGHCPSVDVLFQSVAQQAGAASIGVLLTGMGYDGARGLLAMRRRGARTLAQDEASSVIYGMPKAAYELGAAEQQVPLQQMGQTILSML